MEILIDLLFVCLIVLCCSLLFFPTQSSFQETHKWVYNNFVFQRFMDQNISNVPVPYIISQYLCKGNDLPKTELNQIIQGLIKPGTNYILYSSNNGNEVWLYNKQKTVCLEKLILNKFNITLLCGRAEILFGVWYDWENAPEVC